MIAPYVSPTKLNRFQIALLSVPRAQLELFLDMYKDDRACVQKLFHAGHSIEKCLWLTCTVPHDKIDYTPINDLEKDSP